MACYQPRNEKEFREIGTTLFTFGYVLVNFEKYNHRLHISCNPFGDARFGVIATNPDYVIAESKGFFLALAAQRPGKQIYKGERVFFTEQACEHVRMARGKQNAMFTVNDSIGDQVYLTSTEHFHESWFRKATRQEIKDYFMAGMTQEVWDAFMWRQSNSSYNNDRVIATGFALMAGIENKKEKAIEVWGNIYLKSAFLNELMNNKQIPADVRSNIANNISLYLNPHELNTCISMEPGAKTIHADVEGKYIEADRYQLPADYEAAMKAVLARMVPEPKEEKLPLHTSAGTKYIKIEKDSVRYGDNKPMPIHVLQSIYDNLLKAVNCLSGTGIMGKSLFTFGCKDDLPGITYYQISTVLNKHKQLFPEYYEKA